MSTHFQKKKRFHALLIASTVSLLSIFANSSGIFDHFERKTIDMRTRLCRSQLYLPDDIVIILVDESSLEAMNDVAGRWPWPRSIHGELIDYLSMAGAKSIIMDIMFFENQMEGMAAGSSPSIDDSQLARATRDAGNVIHAMEITEDYPDESNMELLDQPMPEGLVKRFSLNAAAMVPVRENNVFYLPFDQLIDASEGLGVVTFTADKDGINRSERLMFNYQGHFFPTHALAPFLDINGYESIMLEKNQLKILGPDNTETLIPLTQKNEYYANMYGRYNTFSYSGVIESLMKLQAGITENLMVPPEEFLGKIVYVGASAAATHDLKNTAMGHNVPGVFLHASICGNLLTRDHLIFPGLMINVLILVPILFLCVFCVLYMKKITFQIYLPMGLALVYGAASLALFQYNIVIHTAIPLAAIFTAYFMSFTYISFTEGKEKRKVRNILGQYVSPAMLSHVLENSKEEYLKAEVGAKEYLTVFFSDIRGFTSISEKYPVEKVVETLNNYLSTMVDIIFDNNGTLDKFIGDAIVAFWGAPIRFDDHPYKAVYSALQMQQALLQLNLDHAKKGLPELSIGIGIHSDHVILGNIGSRKKLDYTVIGDGVNLTSRIEGLTKTYASTILVSESCYAHIQDKVCCRIADYVKVKGKDQPIHIYQVLGLLDTIDPWLKTLAEKSELAFDLYRKGDFKAALSTYEDILETDPDDGLVRLFSQRCRELIHQAPGPDWTGCFVHQTK